MKELKTRLHITPEGDFTLERNGNALICPYKPAIITLGHTALREPVQQITHMPCGSHCPLFDADLLTNGTEADVRINCGIGKGYRIDVVKAKQEFTIVK
jgi:hypothetical protein